VGIGHQLLSLVVHCQDKLAGNTWRAKKRTLPYPEQIEWLGHILCLLVGLKLADENQCTDGAQRPMSSLVRQSRSSRLQEIVRSDTLCNSSDSAP
jgi:hypothetical protein